LVRIVTRAKALQEFLGTESGKSLLAGYKRAANILSIEEKKDKAHYGADELKAKGLSEDAETALATLLAKKTPELEKLCEAERFADAMNVLAALRAPIDPFFEKTLVNCEDKELRANRLRLLASIKGSVDSIANFSLIEG